MRTLVAFVLAAVLAPPACAMSGPGVVNFPVVEVAAVGDAAARGTVAPSIGTTGAPTFCWELSLFTSSQPLFVFLRRAASGRVVTRIETRAHGPAAQPWAGSGSWSGCAAIPRADARAFLRRPSLYYLDVRTQTALHAARAVPHGPRL